MGAIGWLVDGAAIANQVPLCRASYGPYGRPWCASARRSRSTSARGSRSCSRSCAEPTSSGRWRRDAVDRWYWPSLAMFGRPTTSPPTPPSRWRGRSSASPTTSCVSGS
ncbi:hypothetical protein CTI14_35420 [Methylobacterium radiotolerans]|nr:hypothetical protein CTI14_35420 [Methylobacterium radiotolerans]